jgi:hypothetical protein
MTHTSGNVSVAEFCVAVSGAAVFVAVVAAEVWAGLVIYIILFLSNCFLRLLVLSSLIREQRILIDF